MFPGASEGKRELGDRIELRKESAGSCGPLRLNSVHFYSQNIQRCSNFLPKKLRRLSDVLPFDASCIALYVTDRQSQDDQARALGIRGDFGYCSDLIPL